MGLRRLTTALLVAASLVAVPSASAAVTVGHSGWNWGSPSPQGQTIRALEFAGAQGYAAGTFGTVLATTDGGATWTGGATGITQDLDEVDIVDGDSVVVSGGCYVRRSDDAGRTFRRLPWTASETRCPDEVRSLDFLANETGYLLLTDGSVLRTEDGGRSWSRRTIVPGTPGDGSTYVPTDVSFQSPSEGVVSTARGLYRTTDGAASWTLVHEDPGVIQDVYFLTPQIGFAVGSNRLLRTVDGGMTWLPGAQAVLSTIGCADGLTCIATTPQGQSLMRTSDGGVTMFPVTPAAAKLFAVGFAEGKRLVAAGEHGVTLGSDDAGTTWGTVGARLAQTFTRVRAVSSSLVFAVGPKGGLARSIDGGRTWSELGVSTSEDVIDASFANASVGYAVDAGGTVLRTDNGGVSWQILDTGFSATPQAVLALDAKVVLLIGGRGILRSTDGGQSFSRVRARIVTPVRLFNADRAGGRVFVYGSKNIVASSDRGRTWKKVLRPRKALLASLDFVTGRAGFVLGQDGQMFKTRNGGRRWSDLSGVGSDNATGMSFDTASNGYLALSRFADDTNGYLLHTSDGGRSWRPQLVSAAGPAPDGLVATGSSAAFLLTNASDLLFTTSGGDRGERSKVTIRTARRTVRRRTSIRISGRVRGARAGARVVVARRERGEAGWVDQDAKVASNGTFTTRWRLTKTAAFVAQWAGDEDSAGDGTPALVVRAKR